MTSTILSRRYLDLDSLIRSYSFRHWHSVVAERPTSSRFFLACGRCRLRSSNGVPPRTTTRSFTHQTNGSILAVMELNVHVKNIPSSTFSFLLNKHATLSWRWACALWTTSMSNFSRRLRTRMCQDWPRDPTRREETAERRSSKVQKAIHRDPSMALRIIPNPPPVPFRAYSWNSTPDMYTFERSPDGLPPLPPLPSLARRTRHTYLALACPRSCTRYVHPMCHTVLSVLPSTPFSREFELNASAKK